MATERFDQIVDRLYGEPPANFVAERDAAAKQAREAGDKELATRLKALRRPAASAALVNRLVRSAAEPGIPQLLDLGARLREAQSNLNGAAMKTLGAERNRLVAGLLESVAGLTDEPLTASAKDQLAATFTAAIADPAAESAVSSGRLVNPISYSGFGEVDVSDAVATPLPATRATPKYDDSSDDTDDTAAESTDDTDTETDTDDKAANATREAEERAAAAKRMLQCAQQSLQDAQAAEASAQAALELAERTLASARHTHDNAAERARKATAARELAEQAVADAAAVADGATS
ncbi:hypothetical protein HJ588_02535 [Flexivirga sp. ID2601S]|uniref:Uncharacterized protein n=1 Tax=Flexivirga aerilata TaxID=1656889 RepID=A0A849AIA0_9MICO|nr:hypothetical protein [Flexivirga aerilata]NNG38150.1 hypothetical protein [Flexivirga aerilata]